MNQLYQDANNCEPFDISFGGGVIKVSIDETVPAAAGWKVTIDKQYQLVRNLIVYIKSALIQHIDIIIKFCYVLLR